jgi:carnitine O-acetyltransferase
MTRTFANEDALPRVPLPSIAATCTRFVEWCAPLLRWRALPLPGSA